MTCGSTDEGSDTTLVLAVLQMDGCCVVSERMLVLILLLSVYPNEISWAAAALAPLCGDLKAEDLLPLDVGLQVGKFVLSPALPVFISLGAWPDLNWMSFP